MLIPRTPEYSLQPPARWGEGPAVRACAVRALSAASLFFARQHWATGLMAPSLETLPPELRPLIMRTLFMSDLTRLCQVSTSWRSHVESAEVWIRLAA